MFKKKKKKKKTNKQKQKRDFETGNTTNNLYAQI
jgi:hypothetical protein